MARGTARLALAFAALAFGALAPAAGRAGALVLGFDDGHASWLTVAAPELKRVGGVATAYVNNQRLATGQIRVEDLRELRDRFGWEIAVHGFHHYNAPPFVERYGLDRWMAEELDAAIAGLKELGFQPRALAFPFNQFNETLRRAALTRVTSIRREEMIPLAAGRRADGTIPAHSLELLKHVPAPQLRQWVDEAASRGLNLYLYAHQVLPDREFARGQVAVVAPYTLTAAAELPPPGGRELCLAPDLSRQTTAVIKVRGIKGRAVEIERDVTGLTVPGAAFLVGPCYGVALSEFRALLEYAAPRLKFRTVSQSLGAAAPPPKE